MTRKKLAKQHAARFTTDGLPRDAKEWTEQDWSDLHYGMEAIKAKIAERHEHDRPDATDVPTL